MTRGGTRTGTWLTTLFQAIADATGTKRPATAAAVTVALGVLLAAVWALVYATNGTSNVYLHVMYVPIIIASLTLGILPGIATAVAGAVLVGPLMPMNVELALDQPLVNTIYRGVFFVLVAVTSGTFAESTRWRRMSLEKAQADIAEISARNLRLFARLVAERDEQTGGHCDRVAHNTVAVARAYGVGEPELKRYYWAGLLHDLGKLGVPEAILQKHGRLTGDEFRIIKSHPAFGERMLLDISESFADIALGVRSHHERWDGSGYPDGFAGEAIPLIGRIIAVVDVFEAITSDRPYRGPMDHASARSLIAEGSGTHFDPGIAQTFLRLEREGRIITEAGPGSLHDAPAGMFGSGATHPSLN
jgi:hypothetical protein